MANNLSYLQIFLSGGAGNSSPAASLGGIISSTRVLSQTATAPTTITGVTINDAAGNGVGDGVLSYVASATTLTWQPYGGSTGTAVDVGTSGKYAIQGGNNGGYLMVTVDASTLPGSNLSNTITIANQTNLVWDNISKAESLAGDTEYRCLYIKNTHSTDTMIDVKLWRGSDASGQDVISVELDPVGKGNGSTTGVATTIALETTAPTGVTWTSNAISEATALSVGDLAAGECYAFWEKRVVPANTTTSTAADVSSIAFSAYI